VAYRVLSSESKRDMRFNVRKQVIITCPHCQAELDVADQQIGERVHHARCTNWILVGRRADGTRYGVKVQPPTKIPERKPTRATPP
jgi:predicted Zn finger-like uncharacterized protein